MAHENDPAMASIKLERQNSHDVHEITCGMKVARRASLCEVGIGLLIGWSFSKMLAGDSSKVFLAFWQSLIFDEC